VTPDVKAFMFDELKTMKFPKRRTLLARGDTPILRAGQLAQVFAVRGVGKTWFTRTLAIIMASGGSALGFHVPEPVRVLYVDGEMASEDIQDRDRLLADRLDLPRTPQLVTVAADWQTDFLPRLDTEQGQEAIEPYIDWADVVIADNRSCLFDPEGEKDPSAWQPAQNWLLSLRRRGKAVIIVHHSNRQGGARGIGKAEDPLDLVIKLAQPDDYEPKQGARFELSYVKARGIPGGAALTPVVARLGPDGWVCEAGDHPDPIETRLLDAVERACQSGSPFATKTAAINSIAGKKADKIAAWDRLVASGRVVVGDGGFKALKVA
jgi:hypothetical protein